MVKNTKQKNNSSKGGSSVPSHPAASAGGNKKKQRRTASTAGRSFPQKMVLFSAGGFIGIVLVFTLLAYGPASEWFHNLAEGRRNSGNDAQSPEGEVTGRYADVYDASPCETQSELVDAVKSLAEWMETQHRRMGGRAVNRMYAKKENGRVTVCLVMNARFLRQPRSWRNKVAKGIWKHWAIIAGRQGLVGSQGYAHIVLLSPENRIVGGSKPSDADDIWGMDKPVAQN